MQEQIFFTLNEIINNAIIGLLPFFTLNIKEKYTAAFFHCAAWKKILISLLYGVTVTCTKLLAASCLNFFLNGTSDDIYEITAKYYAAATFDNMLYCILILLIVVFWKYFVDKQKDKRFLVFLTISAYQIILTGIFISYSIDYSYAVKWLGLFLVIMNFLVDIIIFFFMKQLEQKQLMDAELAQLYASREHELARYKDIETQIGTLRKQRHEFANQMQTVSMMMEQHAPAKQITQYLTDILNTLT